VHLKCGLIRGVALGESKRGATVRFFTNKTDPHDITEILLKVALNTTTLTLRGKGDYCIVTYLLYRTYRIINSLVSLLWCQR
jgi:hypothetical protein